MGHILQKMNRKTKLQPSTIQYNTIYNIQYSECTVAHIQRAVNIVHAQPAAQQQSNEIMTPGCPGNVEGGETS